MAASYGVSYDSEGFTGKVRVVEHLDVGIEGVHVNVDNGLAQVALGFHVCKL